MKSNISHFKGSIYPDKTFSIGYVAKSSINTPEREYNNDYDSQMDAYEYEYLDYGRKYKAIHHFFSTSKIPSRFIVSSQSSQRSKPVKRYGLNGITNKGKKVTRNCAILLQQKYGKKRIGFVTCTLPGYDSDVLQLLNRNWGDIVRKFFQQVRRDLKKQKAPLEYVGVTEIQEKRWLRNSGLALHLHFAYVAKPASKKGFYLSSNRFREIWERIINKVLQRNNLLHGCNQKSFSSSIDCVIVKKSVAGYLGKYISKGCEVVESVIEKGLQDSLPSQWWTASMQLKDRLKRKIIPIHADMAKQFMFAIDELIKGGIVEHYSDIYCDWEGQELRIGLCGKITEGSYHFMAKLLVADYGQWKKV